HERYRGARALAPVGTRAGASAHPAGVGPRRAKPCRVNSVEITRTLVKSPPELWSELHGERLADAVEGEITESSEQERRLRWSGRGATGTVHLEPSSWGTKVTLTAEVEESVATLGLWERMRGMQLPPSRTPEIERRLEALLDDLGQAHNQP